jgi:hypothetical protein
VVTGLWDADGPFSFAASTTRSSTARAAQAGAAAAPAGDRRRGRARRTPRLAATYADEFNLPFASLADTARSSAVREAARRPGASWYSVAQVLCCGRDDAELTRRAAAVGRDVDDLRANGVAGTPAEVVDRLGLFGEAGRDAGVPAGARPGRPRPRRARRRRGAAAAAVRRAG